MITFMEWVVLTEAWTKAFAPVLTEGKRGSPVDYNNYAKMFLTFVMDTIEKGSYPDPLKEAGSQLRRKLRDKDADSEVSPSVLGGKMRGALSKISPNDQEEVIMNAAKSYWQALPRIIGDWDKLGDDAISPEDLAGQIAGTIHRYVGFAAKEHFRTFARKSYKHHGTPLSDIGDDEGRRPEAAYGDEEEAAPRTGVGLNRGVWNNAIHIVMSAQESLNKRIKEIQAGKTREKTTQLENRANHLAITLAIMRNMPSQMGQQLGMKGDAGDNRVYDRIAAMVKDPDSDMHPSDRELMRKWASQSGDANHKFRNLIATAIWIAAGMPPGDDKPQKALDEDHWFYDLALDIEDKQDEDDAPASGTTVTPVQTAPVKAPVRPVVTAPAREPEPTAAPPRRGVQKGLFDDMD